MSWGVVRFMGKLMSIFGISLEDIHEMKKQNDLQIEQILQELDADLEESKKYGYGRHVIAVGNIMRKVMFQLDKEIDNASSK